MKLVLTYWVGDGCSYGFEIVEPVEYSSADDFVRDLTVAFEESQGLDVFMRDREFGQDVNRAMLSGEFCVMTVDDWFDSYEGAI